MPKPIAVALGDIHLDNLIWTRLTGVTGDAFVGYVSFLAVAKQLGVPAVIVGDLFDVAKPPPELVRFHRVCMDKCAASNTRVYFLQGNHDKQPGAGWAAATHDWPVYIGNGVPFALNGVQAAGLDYATIDEIEGRVRAVTTPLLFLHQAVRQALGFEGSWNCDLAWVPPCVKLTVLGDIHKPFDMTTPDGRPACYTGSGHARDIDQLAPKSVVVINDDLTYTRHPIPSREIRKFFATSIKDVEEAEAWRAQAKTVEGLKPLLWVAHTAELAGDVAVLKTKCLDSGVLFTTERLIGDEQVSATVADIVEGEDVSAQAQLGRIVNPEKDAELHGFLSELIDERIAFNDIIERRKAAC